MKKKFRCVPVSLGLPIAFASASFIQLGLTWVYWTNMHDIKDVYMGIIIFSFGFILAGITLIPALKRVEILSDRVICKGLFPRETFEIEYGRCTIGMDSHRQYGRRIWWIYLCYGQPPQYKLSNTSNRMNAVKIQPGFIKIIYSDEVYDTLISILPKKQRTALMTARQCAGFDKQGKIIF